MSANHLQKVAIVGASGNVGKAVLATLLVSPYISRLSITLITRPKSSGTAFPSHPSINIREGSYDDPAFLASALAGKDALLVALSYMAMDAQSGILEAAVKAGVKWILPTEYGCDGMNEEMTRGVPMLQPKIQARKLIEEEAVKEGMGAKWVGVATNPWVALSLQYSALGIDLVGKTAKIYTDGGPFNVSTLEQVGVAITRLLALPIHDAANPRASLAYYANNFIYVSSFCTTQRDLLAAVQKATKTTDADWKIEEETSTQQVIDDSLRAIEEDGSNIMAHAALTYALYMGAGRGGDYESKAKEDREVLGLKEEDIDEIVGKIVAGGDMGQVF